MDLMSLYKGERGWLGFPQASCPASRNSSVVESLPTLTPNPLTWRKRLHTPSSSSEWWFGYWNRNWRRSEWQWHRSQYFTDVVTISHWYGCQNTCCSRCSQSLIPQTLCRWKNVCWRRFLQDNRALWHLAGMPVQNCINWGLEYCIWPFVSSPRAPNISKGAELSTMQVLHQVEGDLCDCWWSNRSGYTTPNQEKDE